MTGLVDPVVPQHVAHQWIEVGVGTRMLVVDLCQPLDQARHQQAGQGCRVRDRVRRVLPRPGEAAQRPEADRELIGDAAHELLVLHRFLGEAQQDAAGVCRHRAPRAPLGRRRPG